MKIQYLLLLPCTYRMEKPEPVRLTKQMQTSSKRAVHGHRGRGSKDGMFSVLCLQREKDYNCSCCLRMFMIRVSMHRQEIARLGQRGAIGH